MKKLTKDDLTDLGQYAKNGKWSQTGEDGILLHLFSRLEIQAGQLLDIGAGDGWNLSNSRLLLNHGWSGWLFDGNPNHVGVTHAFFNDENVNEILAKHRVPQELDLLSLDVDGQDWWIWRALDRRPKVVVVEVNGNRHAEPAVTVPRYPPFVHDGTSYYGASFSAFVQLGRARGYTLVHNQRSLNLFFVRTELIEPGFGIAVPYVQNVGQPPDELNREWHYVTDKDLIEPAPSEAQLRARFPEAFARGEDAKVKLLAAEGGCFEAGELAKLFHREPESFREAYEGGAILGVNHMGLVYPIWQFDEKGRPPIFMAEVLMALPRDDWARLIFFLEPHPAFATAEYPELRPLDALRAGRVDDVISAAQAWSQL